MKIDDTIFEQMLLPWTPRDQRRFDRGGGLSVWSRGPAIDPESLLQFAPKARAGVDENRQKPSVPM
ncbi:MULTISPECIES: hypothetical protein [Rhodococcus]|uniref:hypothetical protein n=1 Tax=Rhodococcus TaxID=1827 RepID=UPI0002E361ED|nr:MULTISPECIES: hypothetical protein [Rhodococcus]AWZ26528.1 hypothetical protein CEJ39_22200 [Rhodococcus pyridinivorans]QXF82746.1 hypothetical protein HBA53_18320 [Rhodococcus pyridinivorans]QXU53093.1 hypothetical protein KXC42_20220 [Rhodococcus sp. LW-XY12]